MVARMIWAKGIKEFVEASKILKDRMPHVKFVLVGPKEEGIDDAVPESYLTESERSENFIWTGFRNDVKDLYAISDLAVLPSYYREGGYPRALTEPMAMGKPVITTDNVDCRSTVEHGRNGYLVPIKNAKALADAIEILMNDDKKRERFGQYSRLKAVKEYDEKIIVQQVIKKFLQI
jgi:N,N'-diacetylbacillosaminyl-diphospho-undecaprenol alpha-1,3-N-acetylgalactosaminyltransferase